jgi:hypothetical protein
VRQPMSRESYSCPAQRTRASVAKSNCESVICGIHSGTVRRNGPDIQGFRALSLTAYGSNWHGVCWQAADIMETSCL